MGEAKRRRQSGMDLRKVSAEILAALNDAAGHRVWFNVNGKHEPPAHVYWIADRGASPQIKHVPEIDVEGHERREVLVTLMRNNRPWIGTLVIDFDPDYNRSVYTDLGSWASDIASRFFGSDVRIPSASAVVYTAWPQEDARAIEAIGWPQA